MQVLEEEKDRVCIYTRNNLLVKEKFMDLRDMIVTYKNTVAERLELEKQADALKKKEEQMKDSILKELDALGMQSVKYPDIGHVIVSQKEHYEIRDKTRFATAALAAMVQGHNSGRTLDDAFIAQARVNKEALAVYLEESGAKLDDCGLVLVSKPVLQIRKA